MTLGKGQHSLKETPQSVTVITRKMLDDQNLNTIEQVMEKTPGVTACDSPMGGKYFYSPGASATTPHTELSRSAGSWGNYRAQVDTRGPLNDAGTVRGCAVVTRQSPTSLPGGLIRAAGRAR